MMMLRKMKISEAWRESEAREDYRVNACCSCTLQKSVFFIRIGEGNEILEKKKKWKVSENKKKQIRFYLAIEKYSVCICLI